MTKQCPICKKYFKPPSHNIKMGHGIYCSRSCAAKIRVGNRNSNWRGGTAEVECIVCGKRFVPASRDKRRNTRFCSYECRGKEFTGSANSNWKGGRRSGRKGYERDLTMGTRKYREWRTAVIKRDNKICQLCGTTKEHRAIAHHIYNYNTYPQLRFVLNNGITLCNSCHSWIMNKEEDVIPYFLGLLEFSETTRRTPVQNKTGDDIVRSILRDIESSRNDLAISST